MRAFRETLAKAKNIVVLTGSGVSAESGVPTFRYRGPESLWKNRCVTELATPETFQSNPSLVWEFYSHRRGIATNKAPNGAHKALAELEAQLREQNRNVTVITQNIDKLHHKAGSQNVLEMFGNLFETRCTACGHVSDNHNIPIVPSLKDKGDPDTQEQAPISVDLLPRCEGCGGLLRPHVVWYGEGMEYDTLAKIDLALRNCDLYIQVGSSSQIYPAANYGPMLVARGVPVAEFNHSTTPVTKLLEGAGGYWRKYDATQLATPEAFMANPSLVWEFYSHRREVASTKVPNAGHKAVADLEKRLTDQGRNVTVVTQNIDRLHHKAGSQNIIEMHVPSLQGKGAPEPHVEDASIPVSDLPKCGDCSGLLRPHVVWFGEGLEMENLKKIDTALKKCDLFLLVGTSSVVYPAASYAPMLAARGVPVAEFNLESTPVTQQLGYHFQGKCGSTLPEALAPHSSEPRTN